MFDFWRKFFSSVAMATSKYTQFRNAGMCGHF